MTRPAPGSKTIVVAAVIRDGDRYFTCRRPEDKRHGQLWEFPGGKVEPGETREEAVRRELMEELGLRVTSTGRTRFVATDPGSPFQIEFIETTAEGSPVLTEHSEVAWCTPDELSGLDLAPTDYRFVHESLLMEE